MKINSLKNQARKSYEFARLKMASRFGLIVLPLVLLSCLTCGSDTFPLILGTMLLFVVIAFKWRGLIYSQAVVPGLLAGGAAFAIPLAMHLLGICCRNNLEIFFCVSSGLLGGLILGKLVAKARENRSKVLSLSLVVASLTAALGCASLGVSAIAGLALGLVIAALGTIRFFARNL